MEKSNYENTIKRTDDLVYKLSLHFSEQGREKILEAYRVAKDSHFGQVRKYTAEPYIVHPVAVAIILYNFLQKKATYQMICACLLHDVPEDCEVSFNTLAKSFDKETIHLVSGLTSASKWLVGFNRTKRKAIDKAFLKTTDWQVQSIKCADIIHNTESIVEHDRGFAITYLKEKKDLIPVLALADGKILEHVYKIVERGCEDVGIS